MKRKQFRKRRKDLFRFNEGGQILGDFAKSKDGMGMMAGIAAPIIGDAFDGGGMSGNTIGGGVGGVLGAAATFLGVPPQIGIPLGSALGSGVGGVIDDGLAKKKARRQVLATKTNNMVDNMYGADYLMALGGDPMPQVEIEGQESISRPNGEFAEYEGASHEQGGIPYTPATKGEYVFSEQLGTAKLSKKINKKYDYAQDEITKNTKKLELDKLEDLNEMLKMNARVQQGKMAFGGPPEGEDPIKPNRKFKIGEDKFIEIPADFQYNTIIERDGQPYILGAHMYNNQYVDIYSSSREYYSDNGVNYPLSRDASNKPYYLGKSNGSPFRDTLYVDEAKVLKPGKNQTLANINGAYQPIDLKDINVNLYSPNDLATPIETINYNNWSIAPGSNVHRLNGRRYNNLDYEEIIQEQKKQAEAVAEATPVQQILPETTVSTDSPNQFQDKPVEINPNQYDEFGDLNNMTRSADYQTVFDARQQQLADIYGYNGNFNYDLPPEDQVGTDSINQTAYGQMNQKQEKGPTNPIQRMNDPRFAVRPSYPIYNGELKSNPARQTSKDGKPYKASSNIIPKILQQPTMAPAAQQAPVVNPQSNIDIQIGGSTTLGKQTMGRKPVAQLRQEFLMNNFVQNKNNFGQTTPAQQPAVVNNNPAPQSNMNLYDPLQGPVAQPIVYSGKKGVPKYINQSSTIVPQPVVNTPPAKQRNLSMADALNQYRVSTPEVKNGDYAPSETSTQQSVANNPGVAQQTQQSGIPAIQTARAKMGRKSIEQLRKEALNNFNFNTNTYNQSTQGPTVSNLPQTTKRQSIPIVNSGNLSTIANLKFPTQLDVEDPEYVETGTTPQDLAAFTKERKSVWDDYNRRNGKIQPIGDQRTTINSPKLPDGSALKQIPVNIDNKQNNFNINTEALKGTDMATALKAAGLLGKGIRAGQKAEIEPLIQNPYAENARQNMRQKLSNKEVKAALRENQRAGMISNEGSRSASVRNALNANSQAQLNAAISKSMIDIDQANAQMMQQSAQFDNQVGEQNANRRQQNYTNNMQNRAVASNMKDAYLTELTKAGTGINEYQSQKATYKNQLDQAKFNNDLMMKIYEKYGAEYLVKAIMEGK